MEHSAFVKLQQQDSQYLFPYHYLPAMRNGAYRQFESLVWGMEYLSYVEYVVDRLEAVAPVSLVDIGCGDGRVTREMARRLAPAGGAAGLRLLGIDFSEKAIALARALNPECHFETVDILHDSAGGAPFAAATLIEVLEHIPVADTGTFIGAIRQTLSDRGHLVLTVPTTARPVNAKHFQHFDEHRLEQLLARDFEIVEMTRLNRIGVVETVLNTLMENRLFVLKQRTACQLLYASYKNWCLHADERTGARLCVVAQARQ